MYLFFLLGALTFIGADSYRILAWFPCPSISHQNVFLPILKEMSVRGHEVTVVTPNPLRDQTLKNLTEIDASVSYEVWKNKDVTHLRRNWMSYFSIHQYFQDVMQEAIVLSFQNERVQEVVKKPRNYFDLIVVEDLNPVLFGLQHKFDAPLVAISSLSSLHYLQLLLGNFNHPGLFPDPISELFPKLSLWEKIENAYLSLGNIFWYKFVIYPRADRIARSYFGSDMPYLEEMVKKTSLLFQNVNPVFSDGKSLTPNMKYFSYIRVNTDDTLGQDLKQILDNAKEGVVYFSLGTNVRFDHVQGDVKKTIMEALGDLPYTVICKWESEKLEGQPKNVHLRKWLPQQAILAHPNVKAFVTQGGLQSAEEAIINAVPLVVIPFLGDQPLNAKILTSKGMAETISPKDLNRRILTESIMKVAQDEKYRNKAKELRDIFLDQPQSGIDKVIWWCEYVIRHKGAKHLRSPAADIPLWEYFMLDVLAVVLIALYLVYKITKVTIKILLELFKRSTASTTSKKKKKN
ncbi:UDP-glycosyltransferase UGT5-like isoform X6 [Coccinella septempunctata]|uniref:UDP-glycosyltransferase UGT5-like isoform X6 n=1 Tax=Coccinella septempunctata TaxID=41139 RepID=UPI001D08EB62|nr:UDP-glycosyltransferase UGT5-like isoform X6 [Coccinella septempunctata]